MCKAATWFEHSYLLISMRPVSTTEGNTTHITFKKSASTNESNLGYQTIDGQFVSLEEGEAALHSGKAVLVGGLLVGFFTSHFHDPLACVLGSLI